MYVRDIEKELNGEQNAYNKNENVEGIRRRHEVRHASVFEFLFTEPFRHSCYDTLISFCVPIQYLFPLPLVSLNKDSAIDFT